MLKTLLTDVDGTITDSTRRIDTGAVECIRSLVDDGIEVVLASGNTACFMDALCKMVGTKGTFIAENGGVYRIGYTGTLHITGDQGVCRAALEIVQAHYRKKGIELDLYNPTYRYADLAFARTYWLKRSGRLLCRPAGAGDRHRVCHPPPVRRREQGNRPCRPCT